MGREMARPIRQTINKLTATKVRTLTTPGKHADGGNGLYLRIVPNAGGGVGKSWIFRYRFPPRAKGGGKLDFERVYLQTLLSWNELR